MLNFKKYNGLLFIGDPHLRYLPQNIKAGKRIDNFTETVLDKINQAIEIALKENLYVLFLGDLFHEKDENNIDMITKLIRILKKLPEPCATVGGNHEKSQLTLSDDVALMMLAEAEVIRVINKNTLWGKFSFNDGSQAYVGGTPYGMKIPDMVKLPTAESNLDTPIIWLSHHDLDFGETYPGAVPIKEIKGVSMLVNGHIHKTKKSMKFGSMMAHNPGNIIRLSVDVKDHVPSVWKWVPEQKQELEPIVLRYNKEIFNMIGRQIEVEEYKPQVEEEITPQQISMFVDKMTQTSLRADPARSADGEVLKDKIKDMGLVLTTPKDIVDEIMELADETINMMNSAK